MHKKRIFFKEKHTNEDLIKVINYLDEKLSDRWEIYVEPFLNGLKPNILILHPEKGIHIFCKGHHIKEDERIEFIDNVIFQSKSYEVSGEVAEYYRGIDLIKIQGSPVEFSITSEGNNFNGFSNMILIKKNEIEISGNVLIEDSSSRIRGEKVKFDLNSGKLQVN